MYIGSCLITEICHYTLWLEIELGTFKGKADLVVSM